MSAAVKRSTKSLLNARLKIEATVHHDGLLFRNAMATGHLEHDGAQYTVDLTSHLAGDGVFVQVKRNGTRGWTTYVIPAETLMRAVFDHFIESETSDD